MKIEMDIQCPSCKGTGLYVGMAERDGYAVVCHQCKGTGKYHYVYEYEEFTGRKHRDDVSRVVEVNPGIVIGGTALDFGGVPYARWLVRGTFPPGKEMRQYTCPAWWYQSANYNLKPKWMECLGCGVFSGCKQFPLKQECWDRWDREFGNREEQ